MRRSLKFVPGLLCLAVLVGIGSGRLRAQAVYGNIVGTVVDSSGAAVPGAAITITDMVRNVNVQTTSNESGNFVQRFLIAGTYRVRVVKDGFAAMVRENVVVTVDGDTRIGVELKIGNMTETVQVTAESPLLKTERAEISATYETRTITELPVLGRKFSSFEILTPGFQSTGNQPVGEDPMGSFNKIVNGQRGAGVTEMMDGTDNHSAMLGTVIVQPTLESVVEGKVATQNYDAEFGGSSGAIGAQTRSGTNLLHGSVFEYLRNDHMQARDPFTQAVAIPGSDGRMIPVSQWNQFGGSFGGPIKKNKLFYFGDYQGTRRNSGGSQLVRVPTAVERGGDLNGLGTNFFDPASGAAPAQRTPFTGNRIPQSRLSTPAQNLLAYLPLPNIQNVVGEQPNYVGSGIYRLTENTVNTRWDYYHSEKLKLFGRYTLSSFAQTGPAVYGEKGGGSGAVRGTFAGTSDVFNQSLASGFDYSVGTTLFTDFRLGFYRQRQFIDVLGFGSSPAKDAGIPGVNLDELTSGMPSFTVGGTGGLSFGYSLAVSSCNCPIREIEKQIQFVNNWTGISGNHTIKFGADIRRAFNFRLPSDVRRAGQFSFDAARTQGPSGGGMGLATFLLGDVSSFGRYVSNASDASEQQNRWFFFAQDTWRMSRKFTVSYGLRWELWRPQTVNGAGRGGFLDTTGEILIAGSPGVGLDLNVEGTLKALAPRVGIAYQLTSKTVIRTGYSRGFDIGVFGNVFGHNVTQNLPVLGSQSVNPAQAYESVFTLEQGPPSFNPATVLDQQPKGPNGRPMLPNGVNSFVNPQKIRQPTVDQWNIAVQQQLPRGVALEAAYVGNKGTHNGGNYDFNTATVVGFGTLTLNQRKPFFQRFGWSQPFRYNGSDGSSMYDALQIKAEKRFSGGWSLLSHYTWGRAFTYTGTYFSVDAREAYGPSIQQREHVFVIAPIWTLPIGKGQRFFSNANRIADAVIGGWQMNSIYTRMSGLPFTPSYRDCSADRDTGPCKPDVVGDPYASNPSQYGWFNVASAPLTANGMVNGPWRRPERGRFGSIGNNRLRGPGFSSWDWSMFKSFMLTESFKLQFRAEAYNFANHTNLGQPNVSVDGPGVAGRVFATATAYVPRQWQMGLRLSF